MKVLYGICGIGGGHLYRQLPVLTHLLQAGHDVVVFGYGTSLAFCAKLAQAHPKLRVVEVAVPFYQGHEAGLDYSRSAELTENQRDFFKLNCLAFAFAKEILGRPDLVISDYEPVSAQYAYAQRAPLVTIDQQTKYLFGAFPYALHGCTREDEIERLHMFFPKAACRIITSFFRFAQNAPSDEHVVVVPAILRPAVVALRQEAAEPDRPELVVYLSGELYRRAEASFAEALTASLGGPSGVSFRVYAPRDKLATLQARNASAQVSFYAHQDASFDKALGRCQGVISTAGHGLLSEAMYLGKPVLAIPLDELYEQQMNAQVIAEHGFGLSCAPAAWQGDVLTAFLQGLAQFKAAIAADKQVLMRENGLQPVLQALSKVVGAEL